MKYSPTIYTYNKLYYRQEDIDNIQHKIIYVDENGNEILEPTYNTTKVLEKNL